MSQSLLEMTKELVAAQMRMGNVPAEETQTLIRSTHATLKRLYNAETNGQMSESPKRKEAVAPVDWKRTITKYAIECLECGGKFKNLSSRHLSQHQLDPRTYREKYGIPKTQPLSAHTATARRRELAQQIKPWELASAQRELRKTAAKKRGGKS